MGRADNNATSPGGALYDIGYSVMNEPHLIKYYRQKTNRRLKRAAIVSIGLSMACLLATALCLDHDNFTAFLFMRGCAGLFAIVFFLLVAILVYRVNKAYIKDKYSNSSGNRD